jgi:hypothetical protein
MKRATKVVIGFVVLALVVVLFVLPVVPTTMEIPTCATSGCGTTGEPSIVSVTYSFLHIGYIYIKTSGFEGTGYRYCWVTGDPGNACGWSVSVK